MGVTGLWRLIEPAGKPVPVETLENKVLAVDISIWLHQVVKGYQDAKGAPLPNAHLMGLFQRLCKLLYFRIKPVFVFDGGFPDLKKETIAKRQDSKSKYRSESERIKKELTLLLSKKTAIKSLLGEEVSPKKNASASGGNSDDIFKLPALPKKEEESESESDDEDTSSGSIVDVHSINIESDNFKNLPAKEKYDLLLELKETRKMNSWGRLHELPKKSDNFSDFQMQRLLKRRKVQECLEETEKEMGDTGMSLNDLETLLNETGVDTKIESLPTRRIAANNTTRYLLINNVKQALAEARKRELKKLSSNNTVEETNEEISEVDTVKDRLESPSKVHNIVDEKIEVNTNSSNKNELEDDLEKAIKMSLECMDEPNTSNCTTKTDESWTSCLTDTDHSDYTDSEEEDGYEAPSMSSAKAYIMQYSDFTDKAINKIVAKGNNNIKNKQNLVTVDKVLEEINSEKSIIVDNIHISSSDEDAEEKVGLKINKTNQSSVAMKELQQSIDLDTLETNEKSNQSSVIYTTSPNPVVELLDTTIEDNVIKQEVISPEYIQDNSDSNESEFEDVPDSDTGAKTVVQLVLNTDNISKEDDIFADIFANKPETESAMTVLQEPCLDKKDKSAEQDYLKCSSFNDTQNAFQLREANDKEHVNKIIDTKPQEIENTAIHKNTTEAAAPNIARTLPLKIVLKPEAVASHVVEHTNSKAEPCKDKPLSESVLQNTEIAAKSEEHLNQNKEPISNERLNSMVDEIEHEEQDLLQDKGRLDRIGRNITQQMTKEAQELLQVFGIPYIVAPMEAEAQCAFLESVNLTDGTITDDSDIWLFGGQTVYKNFFNQKKHVLQFVADRIEKSYNLSREQLILLALLVGSDYTTGVTGVGPVTALEILASFPFNKKQLLNEESKQAQYNKIISGLQEFKKWVKAGRRTDNVTLKKKLKNVDLTDDFPSVRVVQAYLEPNVEESEDKFTWGEIDLTILRDYTKMKFGWSQHKLDEIIKPVLKRMIDKKSQKSIQDFFKRKVTYESLDEQMSKRVKAAVQKMGPEAHLEEKVEESSQAKPGRKRKISKKDAKVGKAARPSKQIKESEDIVLDNHGVKVISQMKDDKIETGIEIKIPKLNRVQEIIPQREKDKQHLLQNKLKAIELFRKTKIDKRKKIAKRKKIQPKDKAELSESSDSN